MYLIDFLYNSLYLYYNTDICSKIYIIQLKPNIYETVRNNYFDLSITFFPEY